MQFGLKNKKYMQSKLKDKLDKVNFPTLVPQMDHYSRHFLMTWHKTALPCWHTYSKHRYICGVWTSDVCICYYYDYVPSDGTPKLKKRKQRDKRVATVPLISVQQNQQVCRFTHLDLFIRGNSTEDNLCEALSWKHTKADSTYYFLVFNQCQALVLSGNEQEAKEMNKIRLSLLFSVIKLPWKVLQKKSTQFHEYLLQKRFKVSV